MVKKWAYYNDNDPYVCAWVRNLIKKGLIMDGEVDERSIKDVSPEELVGFERVHMFCGIAGWDYALNLAGWEGEVWTGSCPCPPFSSAGRKKTCPGCGGQDPVPHVGRTGYFVCCLCGHEWLADERHLWPEMWRLIRDARPPVFFGEQVASKDGRVWLTSVRASLEILGYAVGGADLCAASVGAPHIRQRLWFVGYPGQSRLPVCQRKALEGTGRGEEGGAVEQSGGASGPVADPMHRGAGYRPGESLGPEAEANEKDGGVSGERLRLQFQDPADQTGVEGSTFWTPCEWLPCRDGKWRPTQPGLSPLAIGIPGRVGRLRAYGNSICPEVAAEFIRELNI